MADRAFESPGVEPATWFVFFETRARSRWLSWLALGRFKHVSAAGWIPESGHWVFYDVSLRRSRIAVITDGALAWEHMSRIRDHAVTVAFSPRDGRRFWFRVGFWCVPAIAHLVGCRPQALRPDGLYRALLRQGGALVD
jgi:hypothetical protein